MLLYYGYASKNLFFRIVNLTLTLIGNELRWKNKVIQQFTPNLNWLRVGDRLGLLKMHDGSVRIIINSEELHLHLPNMTENQYAILELRGSCSAVAVTSRKIPISPLTTVRLQDSLELALEQDQLKVELMIDVEPVEVLKNVDSESSSTRYEFHENHGRNIELVGDRTVARRVASYNQGLVIVQPALQPGQMVKVLLEQLDMKWFSSLLVGVVSGPPERLNLPVSGLAIKGACCIISNDWISINGIKVIKC